MLKSPDLNRFRVFYCIYTSKGIGAAAKALNVTPSAVSQHLKKLEHEIPVQLQDKIPTFTEKTAQTYFKKALQEISLQVGEGKK